MTISKETQGEAISSSSFSYSWVWCHVSYCLIYFEFVFLFLEATSILTNIVLLSHFYRWWNWSSAIAQISKTDSILVLSESRISTHMLEIFFTYKSLVFLFWWTHCSCPLERHSLSLIYILFSIISDKTLVESFWQISCTYLYF